MTDENTVQANDYTDIAKQDVNAGDLINELANDFHDEVNPPQEQDEPETDVDEVDDADEQELDESDEQDNETDEGDEQDDTETDSDSDDESEPDGDYFEIQGKKYTEQELVELHNSGLRQEDFTKKTQKLADERREFEKERETAIKDDKERYTKGLEQIESLIADFSVPQMSAQELKKLADEDPYAYTEYTAKRDAHERLQKEIQSHKETEQKELQEKQQAEFEKYSQEQTQIIVDTVPEFKTDFENTYKKTLDYMVKSGMDENVANSIADASIIKAFHDSMKLQELTNKGSTLADKKVRKVTKGNTISNTKKESSVKKRNKQVASANSIDDIAKLINMDAGLQ